MLIGVVGKSGSGKSFLARKLSEHIENSIWVDVDKICHSSLTDESIKKELINHFGVNILDNDGVDRKKLSNIVFNNKKELEYLNNLSEGYVKSQINNIITSSKDKTVILDWALLAETEFFDLCDIKVLVKAGKELRAERVIKRDSVDISKFEARERASYSYDNLNFDFVLENNEQLDITRTVNKIYEKSYICS